jgi:hypothetical protein
MKKFHVLRSGSTQSNHLPLKAVVERQLLDPTTANAVHSTIADMANQSPSLGKTENTAGCPHSFKLAILPTSIINGFVGCNNCFPHPTFDSRGFVVLEVGVGERINCNATGEVTYSVTTHAICHNEQVTTTAPLVCVVAHSNLQRILIHGAPHPFVRA